MYLRTALTVVALSASFAPAAWASFPGRNGKLAVSVEGCGGADGFGDPRYIRAFGPRGRNLGRLTGCDGPDRYGPDWSADGRRLALAEHLRGQRIQLTTHAADGSDPSEVPVRVRGNEFEGAPSLSPDGRHIAWSTRGAIYTAALDGSDKRRLRGRARAPDWSPDGGTIVYEQSRGSRNELWLMNARTGEPIRRLVRDGYDADWSPDGRRIVYRTDFNDLNDEVTGDIKGANVWVVRADGTGHRRVHRTRDVAAIEPVWSPNGRSIAWIELDYGPGDVSPAIRPTLWRMRVRGGTPRRLAKLQQPYVESREYRSPELAWQPLP
jgi:Tol biopolymer transport system component